ncbi:unnamed protein product [Pleuronectes platessa]|uniref:Actin interacting protein 3-like C-terminal domain-containing protein n=1 Tax=Pleuronectes platessa TaxID=8262 RepID=A0A9N7Y972_PLEPL|nr:unnamed protein product [Pleuronectes platessa]
MSLDKELREFVSRSSGSHVSRIDNVTEPVSVQRLPQTSPPPTISAPTRTPRVTRLSPTQPALADQANRVSFASAEHLETMSEPDVPVGFNRMNRLRQSLPLARSSSQAKLRAPGVLFLQLGEETRRVHLTHELTSLETLRALIVHMFPQRLTMAMLRSPSTALLIKDETRNIFYELEDPRDVQDRCVIKIYCKEPVYGSYPGQHSPHLANGDLRERVSPSPSSLSHRVGLGHRLDLVHVTEILPEFYSLIRATAYREFYVSGSAKIPPSQGAALAALLLGSVTSSLTRGLDARRSSLRAQSVDTTQSATENTLKEQFRVFPVNLKQKTVKLKLALSEVIVGFSATFSRPRWKKHRPRGRWFTLLRILHPTGASAPSPSPPSTPPPPPPPPRARRPGPASSTAAAADLRPTLAPPTTPTPCRTRTPSPTTPLPTSSSTQQHQQHQQQHHQQQQQLHQYPQNPHHPQQAFCASSSSAILERRDVKPDDEVGGSRTMVLLRGDDRGGGGIYADPYSLGPEASRLSLAGGPHSPLPARADPYGSLYRRGGGGGGGGAGSVRSLTSYSAAALQGELMESGALYRPGGPLYNDAYAASVLALGLRVPPPSSPQKIPDMRDSYGGTLPGRGSPGRQSLRRDSVTSSVFGDSPKARGQGGPLGLTSEQLCLMAGPGGEGGGFGSPLLGNETETRERMEAMEKQIASLTGLLQRVLSRAPEAESPEKMESASDGSGTDTPPPSAPLALMPPPSSGAHQPVPVSRLQMQLHLQGLQQNTNALRKQLSQLRNMQLENQDSVLTLLRQTESELSLMMLDAMRTQEDPLQRQRLLVEEERLKYLNQEELLIQQLQ